MGATLGLLYGSVLAALAEAVVGHGPGTLTPLLLSSAPFGILLLVSEVVRASDVFGGWMYAAQLLGAPLVWAALGALAARSGTGVAPRLARVLVLLQYASGLALVLALTTDVFAKPPTGLWNARGLVIVWATVYLFGQLLLWLHLRARGQA